ncbi:hypothetical protein D0Y65_036289 [Glycine soja]|uniref:Uncharacterized protein n=1 Tax=Glycine soja TaxID=3848 RepID=A0A445HE47_GLYSO|nr:hypothetical protein D0Y65_036289 [Glycine soja]
MTMGETPPPASVPPTGLLMKRCKFIWRLLLLSNLAFGGPFFLSICKCKTVLLNCRYGGAMAVWHNRFFKKCHQIAVALRVSYDSRHSLNGDEQHEQEQQHANSSGTTRTLRSTPHQHLHHDGNDGELHRDDNPSTTHTMNRGRWRPLLNGFFFCFIMVNFEASGGEEGEGDAPLPYDNNEDDYAGIGEDD